MRTMTEIFASYVKTAQIQAVESLEAFLKNYNFRSSSFLQEAYRYRSDLRAVEKNIEKYQNKYYKMCKK